MNFSSSNNSMPITHVISTHSCGCGAMIASLMNLPTVFLHPAHRGPRTPLNPVKEPNLHARLVKRISVADLVIDQETSRVASPTVPASLT